MERLWSPCCGGRLYRRRAGPVPGCHAHWEGLQPPRGHLPALISFTLVQLITLFSNANVHVINYSTMFANDLKSWGWFDLWPDGCCDWQWPSHASNHPITVLSDSGEIQMTMFSGKMLFYSKTTWKASSCCSPGQGADERFHVCVNQTTRVLCGHVCESR